METYIVRQPILNDKQTVVAYELLYKENGINATPDRQEAWVASAVEELLGKANDENFLDDKIAFVTFTPNLLMKNIPRMFPEKSLVIQIGDDSIVHPVAQKMISLLRLPFPIENSYGEVLFYLLSLLLQYCFYVS